MNQIFCRWHGLHFFENKTNGEMKPIAPRKEEKTIVPRGGERTCPTPANHKLTTNQTS
jgi:hypothetical protein